MRLVPCFALACSLVACDGATPDPDDASTPDDTDDTPTPDDTDDTSTPDDTDDTDDTPAGPFASLWAGTFSIGGQTRIRDTSTNQVVTTNYDCTGLTEGTLRLRVDLDATPQITTEGFTCPNEPEASFVLTGTLGEPSDDGADWAAAGTALYGPFEIAWAGTFSSLNPATGRFGSLDFYGAEQTGALSPAPGTYASVSGRVEPE